MNVKQRVVSVSMDSIVLTQMGLIIIIYNGGGHIYWWKELEYTEKTIYLSQVTDKLYHINNVVSSIPHHEQGSNLQLHW
jgi:hypothetical protein